MATIKPFKALRPYKEYAAQLASRPYDVLSSEEARKEATGNLLSFLHVTKAEIDLDPSVDIHSQEVYEKAAENLEQLIDDMKIELLVLAFDRSDQTLTESVLNRLSEKNVAV